MTDTENSDWSATQDSAESGTPIAQSREGAALIDDLDADQQRAVTTDSQLVAVIAGAGSGKTRVLTRRVAWRIHTGSASAAHTVVLTFTREAAGELRRRLPRLGLDQPVAAGTFHSIAHGLLRQRWLDLDKRPRSILTDRRRVVASLYRADDLDAVMAEVDWASTRGLGGREYADAARDGRRRTALDPDLVADLLNKYRQEKRQRGVVDLDDLLALTIQEIERDPTYAEVVRWRFRHLHVDEAQDLNPLQHRFIDLLRFGRDDLFLVGDPAQAIYGFNGSDPALLVDVETRFPGIDIIRLPKNHRCTPEIVAAGRHVLEVSHQPATIESARPDGVPVTVQAHDDEFTEASAVATRIAWLDPHLVRTRQVAVLARTHAALGPVRAALTAAGVAITGARTPTESEIHALVDQAGRLPTSTDVRRFTHDTADRSETSDDAAAVVSGVLREFLREQPTGDGAALRAWINATDPFGERAPGVVVTTFHAAKGREWHTVELIGCETGLLPHKSASTLAAKAEEGRLLYVAITRATDALTINWSQRRNGYVRRLTPFLDGWNPSPSRTLPPPIAVLGARGVTPDDARRRRVEQWRAHAARAIGVLPIELCSDSVVACIVASPPRSAIELDALTGVGLLTAQRWFATLGPALHEES